MDRLIPAPDVLPLPAPHWIFLLLLIATFIIHIIFMNCVLGGSILAAVSLIRGKRDPKHTRLSRSLFKFIPIATAFAVNFGVAPLLFLQVIYGNLMYSSSVLIAAAWFAVIPLIILGYYGSYLMRFKWEKIDKYRMFITWAVALIFMTVAFIYVNNFSLMLRPGTWISHYFKNPAFGSFNWSDPSMYPRYLHILFGSAAVSGIWIMLIGFRKKTGDEEWSFWAIKYGAKIFTYATLINVLTGLWFLISHPNRITLFFLGKNLPATITMFTAITLIIIVLMLSTRIQRIINKRLIFSGAGALFVILILMIMNRHFLRDAYLEPYFRTESLAVDTQWNVFYIFLGTVLLILIPALVWMIKTVLNIDFKYKSSAKSES